MMMALNNPLLPEFAELSQVMDRAFGGLGFGFWPRGLAETARRTKAAFPPINILEDEQGYHVEALAPGVDAESLSVSLKGNQLTISGERKESGEHGEASRCSERVHGRFERTITLPDEARSEKAEATYKNGVLNLTIPKAEEAKPRRIKVNSH